MKNYISFPRIQGTASRQAHAGLPEGTFERELGKEGFFGPATHMYHEHPPTGWTAFDGDLQPRAFDLTRMNEDQPSPFDAQTVLHNAQTKIRFWRAPKKMDHLARNADGDELFFVHEGAGDLYCDYGHMSFTAGDYIVLPRSTMWRIDCSEPVTALLIEATNSTYMLPDKGMVGRHAIFDPAMLDIPELDEAFIAQKSNGAGQETKVRIKRGNRLATMTYPFNPLDAVGWKGDLSVVRINVKDIRPLMSHRYHLPPSAHSTFVAAGFVVCTFVPRPFEMSEDALKVPFYHNNDDYDEVIFYHAGDFFSRDNIDAGMMTFHPCGFTHGPHPKALKAAFKPKKDATNEYAVMIDTRSALEVGDLPAGVENTDYVKSWAGGGSYE
ncbi:homogentisate 1,2-dioxygenase [Hwanghaeella grinnelliae]|uniref:Homogentisate 1,2-dioxygenase n=1 Tax=Hwanghaeella grinnelliae TaxID=2500179 RepID=A0A437QVY9_9PROT|nr:homogentisate 1,2-dioxygenase [Hwanghaeella grinnelliae]RVU38639.1 homogentisate 1,2-dioxygenase [Hwanghaeella grinnelliae]